MTDSMVSSLPTSSGPRDRLVSDPLGRRLPTDQVSGQLQFRFELTTCIYSGGVEHWIGLV